LFQKFNENKLLITQCFNFNDSDSQQIKPAKWD
jgi:hypothetical protein